MGHNIVGQFAPGDRARESSVCRNCHESVTLPPPSPFERFTPNLPETDPLNNLCPANLSWPSWLRQSHPQMSQLNWWRRTNFEGARQDQHFWAGKPRLPFYFDIGEGRLDWNLPLFDKVKSLKKFFGLSVADLKIESGAKIAGGLHIQNNALDLMLQSLIRFQGIWVDGPLDYNFWPQEIRSGDFGVLHLLMDTTKDYYTYFQASAGAYVYPRPPLGHDAYNQAVLDVYGTQYQPPPRLPPLDLDEDPGNPYRLDFILNPFIVEKFAHQPLGGRSKIPNIFDYGNRLPRQYPLEDLLGIFLRWRQEPSDSKSKTPPLDWKKLTEFLKPGASITLDLQRIRDLFVPGLLDLGPSSGRLTLSLEREGKILGILDSFDLNLDPMDYPARSETERPPLHLKYLKLRPGIEQKSSLGEIYSPGIRVHFDPNYRQIEFQANLTLNLALELPFLGPLRIQGDILLKFELSLTPAGPRLVAGHNFLQFRNLKLFRGEGENPLVDDLDLVLTDRPEYRDPILDRLNGLDPSTERQAFTLEGKGTLTEGRRIEFSSEWAVPLRSFAFLDFHDFFNGQKIPLDFKVVDTQGKGTQAHIQVLYQSDKNPLTPGPGGKTLGIRLNTEPSGPKALPTLPLIRDGQIQLAWVPTLEGGQELSLAAKATDFKWGPLGLKDMDTLLQLAVQDQKEKWQVRVPQFRFSANPKGSSIGKFLGRILLEQRNRPGKTLEILWDPHRRKAQIKDLVLRMVAHGLKVLPKKLKSVLDPKVRYLGMDGWLRGHFDLSLPQEVRKWRGNGALIFWGDRDGDVYWLDGRGRRVGPPLLRNTRWDIYRLDGISLENSMAWGNFKFDTILNPLALLNSPQRNQLSSKKKPLAFGARGQRLHSYETNFIHRYQYQIWSPKGFLNRNLLYLEKLCRQDPNCGKSPVKH